MQTSLLRFRNRRGVSLVEMALVLPLLLLLSFGIIEYGWMFLKAEQISNAARSGARYAVTPGVNSVAQVTGSGSPAVNILTLANIPVTSSTISVPTGVTPGTGNPVTVQVSVPYSSLALTGLSLIPTPLTLSASVTMAKEGS